MNRSVYKLSFIKGKKTDWKCPYCHTVNLLLPDDESLDFYETLQSKQQKNHPGWEPDWIEYTFNLKLRCAACEAHTLCIGSGEAEFLEDYDSEGNPVAGFVDVFYPNYFKPALEIFSCPQGTPEDVKEEIRQSFELFFCNKSSALNHIRIA